MTTIPQSHTRTAKNLFIVVVARKCAVDIRKRQQWSGPATLE